MDTTIESVSTTSHHTAKWQYKFKGGNIYNVTMSIMPGRKLDITAVGDDGPESAIFNLDSRPTVFSRPTSPQFEAIINNILADIAFREATLRGG